MSKVYEITNSERQLIEHALFSKWLKRMKEEEGEISNKSFSSSKEGRLIHKLSLQKQKQKIF